MWDRSSQNGAVLTLEDHEGSWTASVGHEEEQKRVEGKAVAQPRIHVS